MFWSLIALLSIPLHALHLGVVQIDHTQGGERASLLIKVFSDDLQSALRAAYPEEYEPAPLEQFCEKNEELLQQYFNSRLQIKVGGRRLEGTRLEYRLENDVYLLSRQLNCPPDWKQVHIKADFFMELFADQSNVISLLHGAERRFFRATRQNFDWQGGF